MHLEEKTSARILLVDNNPRRSSSSTMLFVVVRVRRRAWCRGVPEMATAMAAARDCNHDIVAVAFVVAAGKAASLCKTDARCRMNAHWSTTPQISAKSEQTDDNQSGIVKNNGTSNPARSLQYLRSSSRAR
jgi:hypothetical protein